MKAIVCTKYGPPDILKLKEVPKPTPGDDELLVKVYAAAVTFSNLALVSGKPFVARLTGLGLLKPKTRIPGSDIAGRIEAAGRNVKKFVPGDEVFGDLSGCGRGGLAEYVCAPEHALAQKPANISFEEAAAVPEAALVALQALRDTGQIQKGQKVLIYGASGGIGTFAVQIARYFGAEVTGVCSTRNVEMVRSLGADHVIDYTKEDFAKNRQQYDLILATAGYRSIFDYKRALSPRGIYVATGGSMAQIFQGILLGPLLSTGGKKMGSMLVEPNKDLDFMRELIEAGHVKSVIDRCYPLRETAEALRYYGEGHARGKVVITVGHNNKI
ncbi:MAG: NAD(P)-dependent alcohol dehydrogenase [Methanoregula sp.]|jgi:NADPH:quinone reductase-like Zn-dependent oxidoreductase|nr:NAD(P)-dependent alcohol dehydrogenase [Methanoregula sp.]